MSKNLKLYGSLLSANVRKVQAIALELGIDVVFENINVYAGDGQTEHYLQINNLGQIPTLVDDEIVLSESNAIIVYLSERYGKNALYGSKAISRARVNQWLFWESSQWQPMLTEIMGAHVGNLLLPEIVPEPTQSPDWKSDNCKMQLELLNRSLKDGWLADLKPTLADFSVAAMTTYFKAADFPFDSYPNISKWHSTMSEMKSWKETEHRLWA